LRIEIVNQDITFIVDLRTGDVVTVLSPEMDHGLANCANIRFYKQRKWRKKSRDFKRKERFIT
jgi:hypothetical protein